ncbi:AraC-like DNA-binding protein [Actinoplanes lutulentus]|uniref:AraC family transcriptional regulator n=1 Tax=Actinoplanes lutulentus TaxID=1287878 RepID=A0A327ZE62_9ACTN|nr:AraC family transcriptional regulator [Actinoplanes lutulentus]MBB2942679.1 AraC-like DNA-binding protein [Actinoplanes lutulentus]RAK38260.1 AraC family transcriptional regulator [Actinoplanes lutulentus]
MHALITADTAPAYTPPDRAGIGSCALPVAAGAATGLLAHHALLLTNTGPVTAEVDFTVHRCGAGSLLWIRPGQTLRLEPGKHETTTVVFRPGLFGPDELPGLAPDDPGGPARKPIALENRAEFDSLTHDATGPPDRAETSDALAKHLLAALLLRLSLLDPGEIPPGHVESRTFERFRSRLEQGYPHTRRVEDYAAELGCSVRTLTRASLALSGRTAKQVVDDRVALQARRLLAATPLSVAEVGRSLGFGEPTNFGRFFHRETGFSPGQFRGRYTDEPQGGIPGQRRPSD